MKFQHLTRVATASFALLFAASAFADTIATFADPAQTGNTPLFTLDLTVGNPGDGLLTGGWSDDQTGLDLEIQGVCHCDTWFVMNELTYTGDVMSGQTSPGELEFFADGADPLGDEPLVRITFSSASVSLVGFGGSDFYSLDNVQITGSAVPAALSNEAFAFSFANHVPLGGDVLNGYTVTAAFTSSAIPEPAGVGLLATGSAMLLRRRPI